MINAALVRMPMNGVAMASVVERKKQAGPRFQATPSATKLRIWPFTTPATRTLGMSYISARGSGATGSCTSRGASLGASPGVVVVAADVSAAVGVPPRLGRFVEARLRRGPKGSPVGRCDGLLALRRPDEGHCVSRGAHGRHRDPHASRSSCRAAPRRERAGPAHDGRNVRRPLNCTTVGGPRGATSPCPSTL